MVGSAGVATSAACFSFPKLFKQPISPICMLAICAPRPSLLKPERSSDALGVLQPGIETWHDLYTCRSGAVSFDATVGDCGIDGSTSACLDASYAGTHHVSENAPQGCSSFQSHVSRCDHALHIVPTVEALEEALGLGLMSALMTLTAALSLPSCSCIARDHVLAIDKSDLALLDRPYVSGVGSDTVWIWLGGWCSSAAWGSTLHTARVFGAL
ncbi:hypothetical protein B0H10DRAFT_2220000 [Mycena sp. CBHHK59/15]|nr:hypothetical protein B0H10DRAFT_2220000 [Mycena sp. CBHHK59/15]